MRLDAARRFALSLPLAHEAPHFEKNSFRVKGKIFATVPEDLQHLHIMVDEDTTDAYVAKYPKWCEELWWGMRLCGVRVALKNADANAVKALLEAAWRGKAPKKEAAAWDAKG